MIMEQKVMLLTGAGQIGMAIARRMGYGMKIVIGDKKPENAQAIAKTMNDAGFDVVPMEMDLSSRASIQNIIAEAQKYGDITMLVNAAGVSPSQAPVEAILKVDLYGTAVLLEEVGKVIAPGGALEALMEAKEAGKIGHIGLTAHAEAVFEKALELPWVETIMFPYNIVETQCTHLIHACAEKNIGFIEESIDWELVREVREIIGEQQRVSWANS